MKTNLAVWKTANPKGRCFFCWRPKRPTTHLVKWPLDTVWEDDNGDDLTVPRMESTRFRTYVCSTHAREIVTYQRSIGSDVRAYRYRRVPDETAPEPMRVLVVGTLPQLEPVVRWSACLAPIGVVERDGRVLSPDGVWSKRSRVWLYSHEPERPWAWRTKVGELLTLERRGDRLVGSGIVRDLGLAERMFAGELRPAFELVDVVVEGRTFKAGMVVAVRLTASPAWDEARFWRNEVTI